MNKLNIRSALRVLVITFFLMVIGQTINAATLRWQNDVVDWDDGVILGVYDLFVPQNGKSYDVTFVDGDDPLPIYGLDSSFRGGELYENAQWTTGHQMGALRSYFDELSTTNIDPRLINGIEDKSQFNIGEIHTLYWYNGAGLGQMMTGAIGIYLNSTDMSIGSNWHNPDRFVTYDQQYGDKVYATFVETVPLPPSVVLLGFSLLSLAGIRKKFKK